MSEKGIERFEKLSVIQVRFRGKNSFFWFTVTLLSKSYLLVSKPRFSTHFLD